MKAHRQFSLRSENRMVWSYTAVLLLLGIFVMIRPVIAQDDEPSRPELKIDVQKEYDEEGNLVGVDSTRTWNWSGDTYSMDQFDSLWKSADKLMSDFYSTHPDHRRSILHKFWHWNNKDSTAYSYFNDLFDEKFIERFNEQSENFHFKDLGSLEIPGIDDDMLKDWDTSLEEQLKEMQERIRKYSVQHQELIDKYLKEAGLNKDLQPDQLQDMPFPGQEDKSNSRSGNI